MGFKLILRTTLFLSLLFVMLYVGMTNTDSIKFFCPIATPKPIVQPAALIYFAVFAIGVVAGTALTAGSGGKGGKSGGSSKGGKEK